MSFELVPLDTIQDIAHEYGYWTVFLGIMLENTGVPIPGETITVVGGFLAGSGELDYWLVLLSAVAGAVIGNNFGYWVGYYGGWSLITRIGRLFRIKEEQLISVRDRFADNAASAVFWGRFIALLRIFAAPLAGTVKMPYLQFFACNLAGAAIWAAATVSAAYFAGRIVPLEQVLAWMSQFALGVLGIVAVAIGCIYWLEHRKFSQQVEQQD
ncbi:MAG TPA: DedA family protein [Allocoleopsis sp.]